MKIFIPITLIFSFILILVAGEMAFDIRIESESKKPRVFKITNNDVKAASKEGLEEIVFLLNKDKNENIEESVELGLFMSNILAAICVVIILLNAVIIYLSNKLNIFKDY